VKDGKGQCLQSMNMSVVTLGMKPASLTYPSVVASINYVSGCRKLRNAIDTGHGVVKDSLSL
jgi:hypothetical protein